jgi:PEP-CTERM motif
MYRFLIVAGFLMLGTPLTSGSANAIPALDSGEYSTGTGVPAAFGAPYTVNQGGLCNQSSLAAGCLSIGSGSQGTGLQTGLTGPLANYNGTIAISPVNLGDGDSNYDLIIQISDRSSTAGSYYEVTLNGSYIGETPPVTEGGSSKSSGSITVVLTDGNNVSPATEYLGITNGYFANNASPVFSGSDLSLTVTEVDVPEPASLALFGASLGVMGLMRRYRAGV